MKIVNKQFLLIPLILLLLLTGCTNSNINNKLTLISTSFPGYDFARAITKGDDNVEVKLLVHPGTEVHDYEPTPKDIIDIKNCSAFIYNGGDSDDWVESILNVISPKKTKIIKIMDLVNTVEEEIIDGMEAKNFDGEQDEHVWTNPINSISIIESIKNQIVQINKNNSNLYENNAKRYINKIKEIDSKIRDVVKNSKRKEIVFGDRFPIRYFTLEYGLSYYAAFPGCSHETEANAKTVSYLIDKVKDNSIPVVFHIELSNNNIANVISNETGAKVLEFHTAHNISQSDFDSGITYVDIMNSNLEALKEALN